MGKKSIWVLLGRKLSREASRDEQERMEELLSEQDGNLPHLIEFIEDYWEKERRHIPPPDDPELTQRWKMLSERIVTDAAPPHADLPPAALPSLHGKILRPFWYKCAAAILLLLGGTLFYITGFKHMPVHDKAKQVITGNGMRKHLVLADGTHVWLNSGSTLTYNDKFAEQNREVRLQGEAYFEVAKDANLPFIVTADRITVKVLGTAFNIKDYENEDNIQATLISGKIEISLNDDAEKNILLSPHEKLTIMKKPVMKSKAPASSQINVLKYQVQTVTVNPADSNCIAETAWVDNKLAFVYEPFEEVAKKMERYYNVRIFFKDEELKKLVMSGVFEKESIQQALDVLQVVADFKYRQAGDSIYLYQ